MTPLDKLIASIDSEQVAWLRTPQPGQYSMEEIAEKRGWLHESAFSVHPHMQRTLIADFGRRCDAHWLQSRGSEKAYAPWTEAEKQFAATAASAFYETFEARRLLSEQIEHRQRHMDYAPDAEYARLGKLPADAELFCRLMTSTVSHHVQEYLVRVGIDGKHYSDLDANRFLGVVARGAVDSYSELMGLDARIHPVAVGRTAFERVDDVKAVPVGNAQAARKLLASINARSDALERV